MHDSNYFNGVEVTALWSHFYVVLVLCGPSSMWSQLYVVPVVNLQSRFTCLVINVISTTYLCPP